MNSKTRVVVVDDVVEAADLVAMGLRLHGHDAVATYSAHEAILQIEQEDPQVVLFDIRMPGFDGYDLATMLRHRYKKGLVLIALTGLDEKEPRVAGTLPLVDHFLRKPLEIEALDDILRHSVAGND